MTIISRYSQRDMIEKPRKSPSVLPTSATLLHLKQHIQDLKNSYSIGTPIKSHYSLPELFHGGAHCDCLVGPGFFVKSLQESYKDFDYLQNS